MRHGVGYAEAAGLGESVAEAGGQGKIVLKFVNIDGNHVPLFRREVRP